MCFGLKLGFYLDNNGAHVSGAVYIWVTWCTLG